MTNYRARTLDIALVLVYLCTIKTNQVFSS